MKRLLAVIVVSGFLMTAAPALDAQEAPKDKKGKVTVFDFEEDEVTVSALKPDVDFVGLVQQDKGGSLIKLRSDFVDEIIRSAEDL